MKTIARLIIAAGLAAGLACYSLSTHSVPLKWTLDDVTFTRYV